MRGTWGYMSPEQAEAVAAGSAADLFGLATVLYELAAVQPLFKKEPDVLKSLLTQDEAALAAKLRGSTVGSLWFSCAAAGPARPLRDRTGHGAYPLWTDPGSDFRTRGSDPFSGPDDRPG